MIQQTLADLGPHGFSAVYDMSHSTESALAIDYHLRDVYKRPESTFGLVEITMHELAGKESLSIVMAISCSCKARCTGRFRYLKNQVKCSVRCQADKHDCGISHLMTFDQR